MKVADSIAGRMREERQNVCFTLRQSKLAQVIDIKPYPMCRPVNWMNKLQRHGEKMVLDPARPTTFARDR